MLDGILVSSLSAEDNPLVNSCIGDLSTEEELLEWISPTSGDMMGALIGLEDLGGEGLEGRITLTILTCFTILGRESPSKSY